MPAAPFYAIVAGTGSGTGRAVALRFAQTYPVVLLARKAESYNDIVAEIKGSGGRAIGIQTDVADSAAVSSAFKTIKNELPGSKLAAAIYNVGGGLVKKPYLELKAEDLEAGLNSGVRGFFAFSQKALPLLLEATSDSLYPPSLIVTGATASVKGSAQFGTFAAGKFALRALTQSLSREFGPQGVHVAHAIIDGIIDIERTKHMVSNNGVADGKIKPDAIANTYWFLHTQPRSAFTQEIDLRPGVEKF